jgi:hypothetical protein
MRRLVSAPLVGFTLMSLVACGRQKATAPRRDFVGHFNTTYKVSIDFTTTGAAVPSLNGEHGMTIAATWVGPCAPGQTGGDLIMSDGGTMNLGD